ncbi:MAG: hypothetical protein EA383_02025 [Spirochaetaceae bacterium]|nr:MAG: hypothetical protein EA383_02025 [Spirochaetaceae bacterium]
MSDSQTQAQNQERQRLELMLDSARYSRYLTRAAEISADPAEPLVAEFHALLQAGEFGQDAAFEDFWRAARVHGRPVSAGAERLISDVVRARAAADLTEAWPEVPAADRDEVTVVRDALLDPSVSAVFCGLLHAPLLAALAEAAKQREQLLGRDDDNPIAMSGALRDYMVQRQTAGTESPLPGTPAARALSRELPAAPVSLADAEYLTVRAILTDEDAVWESLKKSGPAAEAWIMRSVEGDYVLDDRMIRFLEVLFAVHPARALRIAGGLFRSDEAGEDSGEPDAGLQERYRKLLGMILSRQESEVLPLLIFIMEPQGKLRPDRETAAALRGMIRESAWFRRVRRLLRRLQAGEPVLVPAGVDFEGFARSELSRMGHGDGTPDPQVLTGIRTRWIHAMHEDLLYSSPNDIPEVSFAEALGEISEADRNAGDIVTEKTTDDPDWILKPAEGNDRRTPRLVLAYEAQASVYEAAGLGRVQQRQLDMTVRDLAARAARSLNDGETDRARLLIEAARGLSPEHPAVSAIKELIPEA